MARNSIGAVALLLSLALPCGAPLPAQGEPAAGYSLTPQVSVPGSTWLAGFDQLAGGDLVYLEGCDLRRRSGTVTTTIHTLAPGTWGAFVQATDLGVFVGESILGQILHLDPGTNTVTQLVQVGQPFDLAQAPDGRLYLSHGYMSTASTYRTEISRLDPVTGGLTKVADLEGPSGPLAFDLTGNLYYALQSEIYPTPPGAVQIIRWHVSQLLTAGPTALLGQGNALSILSGLDGAYDLEVDLQGRLIWSDPTAGGVRRYDPFRNLKDVLVTPRPQSGTGHTVIRLQRQTTRATLDPWQPETGPALLALASDYSTFSRVEQLRPARPALTSQPGPVLTTGPVTLTMAGGPPAAPALLYLSPAALATEVAIGAPRPAPLHLGLAFHHRSILIPLQSDSTGTASLLLNYPGGGGGTMIHLQAFYPGGPYGFFGSSAPSTLRLD